MEDQSSLSKNENKVYDIKGYYHSIKFVRVLLRLLGGWPDPENENYWSTSRYALIIVSIFFFNTVSQTVKMAKNIQDLNLLVRISVDCNIPTSICIIKLLNIWFHKQDLKLILQQMIKDWKKPRGKDELDIMWKYASMTRFYGIVYVIITKSVVVSQLIGHLIEPIQFLKSDRSNETGDWPLYFKGSFPYNYKRHPNYELTMVGQCITLIAASFSYDSIDVFFCTIILHLIAQVSILKMTVLNLNSFASTSSKNDFLKEIYYIYKEHNHLWRISVAINDSFSTMFLFQIIPSMLVLVAQAYYLIMLLDDDKISWIDLIYLLYFLALFLLNSFTYCFVGEVLRQESLEIGDAAYNCNWVTLPAKEAKLLVLVMRRAQNPFEITLGKFAIFSLNLYCNILKTSAGYLSMLLAVKDKTNA